MGALHAQSSAAPETPPAYSDSQGQGGGPGKLGSDLQSLLAKLTSDSDTSASATDSDSAVSDLETAFKNLLDKLGGTSTDDTGTDSSTSTSTSTSISASDTTNNPTPNTKHNGE